MDLRGKLIETVKGFCATANQPFGGCCGGLDTHVGNIVKHRDIAFMPYPYNDRQRELGNVGGKIIVFKRGKIARGSAAAYDHHPIPHFLVGSYLFKSLDYSVGSLTPLHQRRIKAGGKTQMTAVGVELMDEIAVAGRSGAEITAIREGTSGHCNSRFSSGTPSFSEP